MPAAAAGSRAVGRQPRGAARLASARQRVNALPEVWEAANAPDTQQKLRVAEELTPRRRETLGDSPGTCCHS